MSENHPSTSYSAAKHSKHSNENTQWLFYRQQEMKKTEGSDAFPGIKYKYDDPISSLDYAYVWKSIIECWQVVQ